VIMRLANGDEATDIARNMALTEAQVQGLKPYVHTARNVTEQGEWTPVPDAVETPSEAWGSPRTPTTFLLEAA
jgi:hypothetical protein